MNINNPRVSIKSNNPMNINNYINNNPRPIQNSNNYQIEMNKEKKQDSNKYLKKPK